MKEAYIHRLTIKPTPWTGQHCRRKTSVGFQVKLSRYAIAKWFDVSKYEDEAAALRAAIRFRNKVLRQEPTAAQRMRARNMRKNYNKTRKLKRERFRKQGLTARGTPRKRAA